MATHSSILTWETPWTEEPGGLQSVGSQKSLTQLSEQTTATQHSNSLEGRLGSASASSQSSLSLLQKHCLFIMGMIP